MVDKLMFWIRWIFFWSRVKLVPVRGKSRQLQVVEYGCGYMFYCPHCEKQTTQNDFLLTGAASGVPGFIEELPRYYDCEHCGGLIRAY